jgi:heat shock protein HslJ
MLTPAASQQIGSSLGIDIPRVQPAFTVAAASQLDLLSRLGTTPAGAAQVLSLLQTDTGDFASGTRSAGTFQQLLDIGAATTHVLFGERNDEIAQAVGTASGIPAGSAERLMAIAVPAVLGVLRNQVTSANLDAAGLTRLLHGEQESFRAAMPAGLRERLARETTGAVQVGTYAIPTSAATIDSNANSPRAAMVGSYPAAPTTAPVSPAPAVATVTAPAADLQPSIWRWLLPLLALLAIGGLLLWALNRQWSTAAVPATLAGRTWYWERTLASDGAEQRVGAPDNYSLSVQPGGALALQADCNRGTGQASADGTRLTVSLTGMTSAACGDGSLGTAFTEQLQAATGYVIDAGRLQVTLGDGRRMEFAPAP